VQSNNTLGFLSRATSFQRAIFGLLRAASFESSLYVAPEGGFNASLVVRQTPQLPNNQWMIESKHFMAFSLAYLQAIFTDAARGPEAQSPGLSTSVNHPVTEGEVQLCGSQKMRKAGGFV